jgi:CTP:molybdopterin cytidylyltransferase MocA
MRVAAVVLAAGASTRLGRPKQSVMLGGETLLERAVRVAREAELSPVIVVVRELDALMHRLQETGCLLVLNGEAAEGMAASIRCGVRVAETLHAEGVVVMACDQVLLRAEHLRALCAEPGRVTASEYAGRRGVPAYFPAAVFGALLELRGDVGAREMLREAASVLDEGLAVDVDTEADVHVAEERLGLIDPR